MNCRRCFAVLVALALAVPAAEAGAMTFEPDEVEQDQPDDDGGMTFAPEDLEEDDFDAEDELDDDTDVGVVAVPGEALEGADRDEVQDKLVEAAEEIPEINVYGDTDLLPRLEERDPVYCSTESLCLASVGESAGVDRILQARVERIDGDYRLDLDYFDVGDRLFVAYHSNSGLSSLDELQDELQPGVDDIFGIRRDVGDDPFVDDRDVDIVSVLAYSTGGAAVLSLGTGVLFGLQVSSQQSELEEARDEDGRYPDLTQRQAHDKQRNMENNALTANVFYGLSAALGVTSIALFVLGGGDDDAELDEQLDDEQAALNDTSPAAGIEFIPRLGGDSVGFGARIQF